MPCGLAETRSLACVRKADLDYPAALLMFVGATHYFYMLLRYSYIPGSSKRRIVCQLATCVFTKNMPKVYSPLSGESGSRTDDHHSA